MALPFPCFAIPILSRDSEIHLMVHSRFGEICSFCCSLALCGSAGFLLSFVLRTILCTSIPIPNRSPDILATEQTPKPNQNTTWPRGEGGVTVGSFERAHSNLGRSAAVHRSALGRREGGRRCFGSFNQHLEPCFTNSPPPPRNSGGERERERERAAGLGGGRRRGALLGR